MIPMSTKINQVGKDAHVVDIAEVGTTLVRSSHRYKPDSDSQVTNAHLGDWTNTITCFSSET